MSDVMGLCDIKHMNDSQPCGTAAGTRNIDKVRNFIKENPRTYRIDSLFDECICKKCLKTLEKRDMKTCSQCNIGVYCSKECFVQDYQKHKETYH